MAMCSEDAEHVANIHKNPWPAKQVGDLLLLGPKLFFSSLFHPALALGAGMSIPQSNVIAATL
jgi:hypothetical protein